MNLHTVCVFKIEITTFECSSKQDWDKVNAEHLFLNMVSKRELQLSLAKDEVSEEKTPLFHLPLASSSRTVLKIRGCINVIAAGTT